MEKNPEVFSDFLKRDIYDCVDHEEYVLKNGGLKKMWELRTKELMLFAEEKR
ncbi:MAG: hypothetical protein ACKVE4_03555 [Dissulfuribacterales bacterium]